MSAPVSSPEPIASMLTGGHPNSLGRTLEVVDLILTEQAGLEELYQCYFSEDEVVRLRTSNAMKRICQEHPEWLMPYMDRFLTVISKIEQPSTQWTLAQLFLSLEARLDASQRAAAIEVMKHNLTHYTDWIVINQTIQTLGAWAKEDSALKAWLLPQLTRCSEDSRKSVAKTANKWLKALSS